MADQTTSGPRATAQAWADDAKRLGELEANFQRMRLEIDNLKIKQETRVKELRALVINPATPFRIFEVSKGLVVQVSTAGVHLVQVENASGNAL